LVVYAVLGLRVWLGLTETHDFVTFAPLTAFFQNLHTLEALEDITFCGDGAGTFETAMLRHKAFGKWARKIAPHPDGARPIFYFLCALGNWEC